MKKIKIFFSSLLIISILSFSTSFASSIDKVNEELSLKVKSDAVLIMEESTRKSYI